MSVTINTEVAGGAGSGSGSGVNATLTAAQLEAARLAGTLTAGTIYSPSDITPRLLYWAQSSSALDPLGSQMAYVQESTASNPITVSNSTQTTIATVNVLGYKELICQYENLDADPLSSFEIAVRAHSSADFVVTHLSTSAAPTADFTTLDDLLIACYTDTATADLGVLATGNAFFRLNVAGLYEVRVRAQQSGAASGTADFYATKVA